MDISVERFFSFFKNFFNETTTRITNHDWSDFEIVLCVVVALSLLFLLKAYWRLGKVKKDMKEIQKSFAAIHDAFKEVEEKLKVNCEHDQVQQRLIEQFGLSIDGIGKDLSPDQQIAIRESAKNQAGEFAEEILKGDFGDSMRHRVETTLETLILGLFDDPTFIVRLQKIATDSAIAKATFDCSEENKDRNGNSIGTRKILNQSLASLFEERLIPEALDDEKLKGQMIADIKEKALNRGTYLVSDNNKFKDGKFGKTRQDFDNLLVECLHNVVIPKVLADEDLLARLNEGVTTLSEAFAEKILADDSHGFNAELEQKVFNVFYTPPYPQN